MLLWHHNVMLQNDVVGPSNVARQLLYFVQAFNWNCMLVCNWILHEEPDEFSRLFLLHVADYSLCSSKLVYSVIFMPHNANLFLGSKSISVESYHGIDRKTWYKNNVTLLNLASGTKNQRSDNTLPVMVIQVMIFPVKLIW